MCAGALSRGLSEAAFPISADASVVISLLWLLMERPYSQRPRCWLSVLRCTSSALCAFTALSHLLMCVVGGFRCPLEFDVENGNGRRHSASAMRHQRGCGRRCTERYDDDNEHSTRLCTRSLGLCPRGRPRRAETNLINCT